MIGNDTARGDGAERDAVADDTTVDEQLAAAVEAELEADPVAALEAERADLKERLMRALAETENLRRRSEREVADARTYAVTSFARDTLTVADNIRRALESIPKDDLVSDAFRPFIEGIELTERDLLKTLGRHKVQLLEPQGQKFDPNMHQAMFEVPDESVPSGTVVQVIQTGYAIGDRVLRPALVGIAKGGPKASSSAAAGGGATENSSAA